MQEKKKAGFKIITELKTFEFSGEGEISVVGIGI